MFEARIVDRLYRLRAASALGACLLCLALPGCSAAAGPTSTAAARPASGRFRAWLYPNSAEVLLRGTNGYRLTIFAASLPADKIDVYAVRGEETTTYEAPATVTRTSIKASLGRLGRIDGTFRPTETVLRIPVTEACTSNRPPVLTPRLASFRGMIALHGEGGFTEAMSGYDTSAPRPKAECESVVQTAALVKAHPDSIGLIAGGSAAGRNYLFAASRGPVISLWPSPPPPAAPQGSFAVYSESSAGPVKVSRVIQMPAAAGQFSFVPDFSSAQVDPPAPFTGSGSFQEGSGGSAEWSGDLAVAFPGLEPVALTGSGFEARLGKGSELVSVSVRR